MKKLSLLTVVGYIFTTTLQAQVKIGNTGVPNASAVLELDGGTNKGFLMPRLTNAQMIAIASPPNGLMVYNTTDNYVYTRSGSVWRPVADGSNPLGAAIPYNVVFNMPSTNLITVENSGGTTNFSVIKGVTTAGTGLYGAATTGNGVVGISNTGNAGAFTATGTNGVGGYFSSLNGPALITNSGYVGIGVPAPQFIMDIGGRIQLRHDGNTAGMWLQRADNNHASFVGQLNDTTYGIYDGVDNAWKFTFNHSGNNFGIGTLTPKYPLVFGDAVGDKISFFGGSASNTANHYGIGIQSAALQIFTPSLADDIVFGHGRSGAFTERIRFTGDGKVGIGNNNPSAKLDINGTVRITDGQQGNGKVLTSDLTGNASWQKLPTGYGFHVVHNTPVAGPGGLTILRFPSVFYNDTNPYDPATGEYTAPEDGFYHFEATIVIDPASMPLNNVLRAEFRLNGTSQIVGDSYTYRGDPSLVYLKISTSHYMVTGSKMAVHVSAHTSSVIEADATRFSGFKVY